MFHTARYRRSFIVCFELALVVLANYLAFSLRYDGDIPPEVLTLLKRGLPLILGIRALSFIPFRLYQGLWKYTSLWDLRNIVAAVVSSSVAIHFVLNSFLDLGYPRSILIIDALLLLCFMTGVRLSRRIFREMGGPSRERGVLVYGAGDAGEMVVRDMKNNDFYKMDPIGFIDDDPNKTGHRIHGVPVLGTRRDLDSIMRRTKVQEVLIAMPKANGKQLRAVLKALEPFKVPITTLPSLRDLLDGKVTVSQIRSLALEDLLQREPVGLDAAPVRNLIHGRRILVTGAGGSIGAELCRQIAQMEPDLLILFERHEHGIYSIEKELQSRYSCKLTAKIVDVTNRKAVRAAMEECKPDIVFHAAAYKHVPILESNICEAIRNNVGGTRVMAEESQAGGVKRFILISTDKAVNPASIMGASKRVGECMIQSMATHHSETCFNIVRFGNVLGSSGSVVPLFLDQIQAGGPVTVTHPEMRRYFMLIPEAVQLVLHAAAMGEAGSLYILNMGEEFSVLDLAKNLIRLSGHVPDEDIQIKFTGLRPGEKLSETLIGTDETVEAAAVEEIRRVRSRHQPDQQKLEVQIARLEAAAHSGNSEEVLFCLQDILPGFRPQLTAPARFTIVRAKSN